MKHVAVIGATGTIGGAVADALETRGHGVHRLARSTNPAMDLGAAPVALVAEAYVRAVEEPARGAIVFVDGHRP